MLATFNSFLTELEWTIRRDMRPNEFLVVAGDFNAKSSSWGSDTTDAKGEALEAFAASLGIWVCNVGNTPTFVRGTSVSIIDVTFASPGPTTVHNWRVLDEYSASDHQYIAFEVGVQDEGAVTAHHPIEPKWAFRKLDREALQGNILQEAPRFEIAASADATAEQLNELLVGACNASMSQISGSRRGHRGAYWWSDEIAARRRSCIAARRRYQRSARRLGAERCHLERGAYREACKDLRLAIPTAQEKCWRELCAAVDSDPWGVPYRVVTKRLCRQPPGAASKSREAEIASALFPARPRIDWRSIPIVITTQDEHGSLESNDAGSGFNSISIEEVQSAARRLPSGKVPGLDGVQLVGFADDLAVVATARTTPFLETVVNSALSTIES